MVMVASLKRTLSYRFSAASQNDKVSGPVLGTLLPAIIAALKLILRTVGIT